MRKFLMSVAVSLAVVLSAPAADAQVRIQTYIPPPSPDIIVPKQPRLKAPRAQQVRPKNILLPPSAALKRALGAVGPGVKPLGVKLRGNTYVVRLKQGGTIRQLGVDSVTGVVTPLP